METRNITPGDLSRIYKSFAMSEDGQVILADLMRRFAYVNKSTSTVANYDPNQMLVLEGQRSVVVYIGHMIETDPNQLDEANEIQDDLHGQEIDVEDLLS